MKTKSCNTFNLTAQPNTGHIPGNQGRGTKGSQTGFRRFLGDRKGSRNSIYLCNNLGFPDDTSGKEPTYQCSAGSTLASGRSPGGGCGNPLQYSCLEKPMDRGVHGVAKGRTGLSTQHACNHSLTNSRKRCSKKLFKPRNRGNLASSPKASLN